MRLAYVTAMMPYGGGETFFIPECMEIQRRGHEILLFPLRPRRDTSNLEGRTYGPVIHRVGLITPRVLFHFLTELIRRPFKGLDLILKVIFCSGSLSSLFKNIAVLPKGFYAAHVFRRAGIEHMHATWATATATCAFIASGLTGIPWSMSIHRGDLEKKSLSRQKMLTVSFVRAINNRAREKMLSLSGNTMGKKITVLRLGVNVPELKEKDTDGEGGRLKILCPAYLHPIKGHTYLLEALKLAIGEGLDLQCLIAGDGPTRPSLELISERLGLGETVKFLGRLPHARLLDMLANGDIAMVVLPSITYKGEAEGIPVSLMEAMAHGVPVISTKTGGTPELLADGCGVLVEEKNPDALAKAILKLATDEKTRQGYRRRGYEKVRSEFNSEKGAAELIRLIYGTTI